MPILGVGVKLLLSRGMPNFIKHPFHIVDEPEGASLDWARLLNFIKSSKRADFKVGFRFTQSQEPRWGRSAKFHKKIKSTGFQCWV
jgi:RNase H-fold protein (predicted Holliday junction resolvase)